MPVVGRKRRKREMRCRGWAVHREMLRFPRVPAPNYIRRMRSCFCGGRHYLSGQLVTLKPVPTPPLCEPAVEHEIDDHAGH
jgi:hypothetical protein